MMAGIAGTSARDVHAGIGVFEAKFMGTITPEPYASVPALWATRLDSHVPASIPTD